MVERTSYRVYTAHELRHMPQAALRLSAPPPKTGITGSGVAFLLGVALAIGGASWAAMHYVKPDFVATASAAEAKAAVPGAPGTFTSDPAAPPAFAPADPSPAAAPAPPPTSASAKQFAKPKKGRRQARPRPADSGSSGDNVPPNPFDSLAAVDRAPTTHP